jgi:hypothetical protein
MVVDKLIQQAPPRHGRNTQIPKGHTVELGPYTRATVCPLGMNCWMKKSKIISQANAEQFDITQKRWVYYVQ